MSEPRRRLHPDLCQPAKPDLELLERIERDENTVNVMYVGTIGSGADYRDMFLAYTKEGMLHIVAVRRLCIGEKEAEKLITSEEET